VKKIIFFWVKNIEKLENYFPSVSLKQTRL